MTHRLHRLHRVRRWAFLAGAGLILLQAPGCDTVLQVLQTALLAALTGTTFYLARNV